MYFESTCDGNDSTYNSNTIAMSVSSGGMAEALMADGCVKTKTVLGMYVGKASCSGGKGPFDANGHGCGDESAAADTITLLKSNVEEKWSAEEPLW